VKVAALVVPLMILLSTPCCAMGRGSQVPPRSVEGKSSLQLIAEALEKGEIDQDTATLYRVYAVFDDSKLPPGYRGSVPIKDGTPVLRDARRRYGSLRPQVQKALNPYLFPKGRP
jgi:hypothetical protein